MPVRYKLVQHRITPDPNDFFASVQPIGTLDTEGLVRRLLEAGSTVTEADLRAVLALLRTEIHSALSEGYRVHLEGVGHLYLTIAGTFHGLTDSFDPARHTLQLTNQADATLLAALRRAAQFEKQTSPETRAHLLTYTDLASGTVNSLITPGTIGTLDGARMRVVPARADEGLYAVPEAGGAEVKVPAANFQRNKPAQIIFLVPELAPGQWRLQVRNRPGLAASASLRVAALNALLTRP